MGNDAPSGTTNVRNDAEITKSEIMYMKALDDAMLKEGRSGYVQDVKDFLAKPVIVRSGTFTGTNTANERLAGFAVPEEFFAVNPPPVWVDKIKGYLHIRGTMVLRLQVNANKFQQGRLLMCYVPQGQVYGTYPYARLASLVTTTQLPNVQLDIACDTEAILEVPYTGPTTFYNIRDGTGPMATAFLMVYEPLSYGTGSSECEYTLWASWKDVEIVTPTNDVLYVPQVDFSEIAYEPQMARKRTNRNKGQMNVDAADAELEANGAGPVESVFRGVRQVSSALTDVPFLSSVAAPVSWVASALESVASFFGWSNPNHEDPAARMVTEIFPYVNNSNAIDNAYNFSLKADNKVEILPGFAGTDLDEMNIKFLAGVPAFYQRMTWSTSNAAGLNLGTWNLNPGVFQNSVVSTLGTNNYTAGHYTPCAFLSKLFKYWRGSLKFTFKIVKTSFHSGRLLFAFDPGHFGAVGSPTLSQTNFLYREIIDMRECNEFSFVIPYTSNKTWLRSVDLIDPTARSTGESTYGKAYLFVLNELVAPDTCSNTVQILMEVSMAQDAEFAVPTDFGDPAFYRPVDIVEFAPEVDFTPQMDTGATTENDDPCAIAVEETVGTSSIVDDSLAPSKYCIGEKVTSILQLLKRTTWPGIIRYGGVGTMGQVISCRPFTAGAYVISNISAVTVHTSRWTRDYISILSPLYAYRRGGVRLRIFTYGAFGSDQWFTQYAQSNYGPNEWTFNDTATPFATTILAGKCGSMIPWMNSKSGGASVQIPAYHQLHSRLVRVSGGDSITDQDVREPIDLYSEDCKVGFGYISAQATTAVNQFPAIGRQVADDFSLGFFLGVPPYLSSIAAA